MALTATREHAHAPAAPAVVWHDIECGDYRDDLELWRELAQSGAAGGGPILDAGPVQDADSILDADLILDVGAGTGRVALALARAGHPTIALDSDATLLAELARRASGLPVRCVVCDARQLTSAPIGARVRLCIVAMQTIQLLGGPGGRAAFLRALAPLMAPDGLLACAIAPRIEPFDVARGSTPPAADRALVAGTRYTSQPTAARRSAHGVVLERRREIVAADGSLHREQHLVVLDSLSAATLQREARGLGWHVLPAREIPSSDDYVGATVVMLGA